MFFCAQLVVKQDTNMPPPVNKFKRFRRGNSGVEPNKKQAFSRPRSIPTATARAHVLNTNARNLANTSTQEGSADNNDVQGSHEDILPSEGPENTSQQRDSLRNQTSHENEVMVSDDDNPISTHGTFSRDIFVSLGIPQRAQMWKHPYSLLAVLLARGSLSLTKEQYERMRRESNPRGDTDEGHEYPSYSSMDRSTFRYVEDFLCVQYSLAYLPWKIDKASNDTRPRSSDDIGIVFPTQWAKYDIRDPVFYNTVYESNSNENMRSFSNAPINRNRTESLEGSSCVRIPDKGYSTLVREGDKIRIEAHVDESTTVQTMSPFSTNTTAAFVVTNISETPQINVNNTSFQLPRSRAGDTVRCSNRRVLNYSCTYSTLLDTIRRRSNPYFCHVRC